LPLLDQNYELITELGRGATGTVWEARSRATSEIVAIKILHSHLLESATARKRFQREVESASNLHHPHCIEVLGHGQTADNTSFLVMERLYGTTLESLLENSGPLRQERAIKIAAQILDAIGAAHRLGIVHRDLKPCNVMLIDRDSDSDFVKVCDFGLAKAIEADADSSSSAAGVVQNYISSTTRPGEICGTPAYMAPEQACGEPIDARADLYAVGVMLFRAIVGQLPFSGRSILALLSMHLTVLPPNPSKLRPDLGIFPPLENLILRALAKDRAERPSSAEVFRADLLQIQRDLRKRGQRWATVSQLSFAASYNGTLPASKGKQWRVQMIGQPAIHREPIRFLSAQSSSRGNNEERASPMARLPDGGAWRR
jgi:serine/threonine-protein kinase